METGIIYTLGHGNQPLETFLDVLKNNHINILVDIRAQPNEQCPSCFYQHDLQQSLAQVDITYHWAGRHLGEQSRQAARNSVHTALDNSSQRSFADHMSSETFKRAIAQLLNLASTGTVVLLASKVEPEYCHRQYISDYLLLNGIDVRHVLDKDKLRSHLLSPYARRESAELIYDRVIQHQI